MSLETDDLTSTSKALLLSIFSSLLYVGTSIASTFANKIVLSVHNFKHNNLILSAQLITTVIILRLLHSFGIITLPALTFEKSRQVAPVAFLYTLNVGLGLSALGHINIPLYGILKRLSVVVVLAMEVIILHKKHSSKTVQAVILIVVGALLSCLGDLEFNLTGYLFAVASVLAQSSYLIYLSKSKIDSGLDAFGSLYLTSTLSLPFLLPITFFSGEFQQALQYPHLYDPSFQIAFFLCMSVGIALNFSIFFTTLINSALTTTILGHMKALVQTIMGFFLLGGVELTPLLLIGCVLNTVGSYLYAYLKYLEHQQRQENPLSITAPPVEPEKQQISQEADPNKQTYEKQPSLLDLVVGSQHSSDVKFDQQIGSVVCASQIRLQVKKAISSFLGPS